MLKDLVTRNRSTRRFRQGKRPDLPFLRELVGLARLCPSGTNKQPIRYFLSVKDETNLQIFPHLRWAGYIEDWPGPDEGERPTAYIVILGDTTTASAFGVDHGIAAQTMLLRAVEEGFAGCMLGSIDRDGLAKAIRLEPRYRILLVVALGEPGESVVVEGVGPDGDIKYWRDPEGLHHVPKRSLDELIVTERG